MSADAPDAVETPILMWHHVGEPPNESMRPYAVPSSLLSSQLDALLDAGYQAVTFEQLRTGVRPERPVVLTFDDGFTSFLELASPALLARGMRAVSYIVAGSMGGVNDWDPDSTSLELMDADAVWTVAQAGHELGVHGWRHRPMPGLAKEVLERELLASRAVLEDLAARPVRTMSYPHGEADSRVVDAVAACGFEVACLDSRPPEPGAPPSLGLSRIDVGPETDPRALLAHLDSGAVRVPVERSVECDPFARLVARTLEPGIGRDPMSGWAAVHRASGPLGEVLSARGLQREQQPFAKLVSRQELEPASCRSGGGAALAAAVAPLAANLDARHDRNDTMPVWGASSPEDARAVPASHVTLGPRWSDPVRHLWAVEPSDHAMETARYLRAASLPARQRHVRETTRDLPVIETAMLATEADEHDAWAQAEAAFTRVDVDGVTSPTIDRSAPAERLLLARAAVALVRQELQERYRGSWLGIGWAVAQPIVTFVVLGVFFGGVVRIDVDRYAEFLLAGLVPWMFLHRTAAEAPGAVRGRGELLRLAAFPRLALPLASVTAAMVDLLAQLAVVTPLLVAGAGPPPVRLLLLPFLVVLLIAFSSAVSIVLAGITVSYRDVAHLVPLALTVLFYAVPVVYPPSLVPAGWRGVYNANPVAVLVQLFRAALYGSAWPPGWATALSVAMTAGALVAATLWFRQASDRFVAEA